MSFRTPQIILRESAGHYDPVTGLWVAGTRSHFTVMASVQPINADDMKTMPEGRYSEGMVKVYTSTELQSVEAQSSGATELLQPDRLVWRGRVYELSMKDDYQSNVISHFRYRFRLLGTLSVPVVQVGSVWDSGATVWDAGESKWDIGS